MSSSQFGLEDAPGSSRKQRSRGAIVRRRIIWIVGAILIANLALRAWVGYTHMVRAQMSLAAVQTRFGNQAPPLVATELAAARRDVRIAKRAIADDPAWWLISKLPVAGATPSAIRVSIAALDEVLGSTTRMDAGLRNLRGDTIANLSEDFLSLADKTVADVAPAVIKADDALQALNLRFVPRVVAEPVAQMRDQLHGIAANIADYGSLIRLAPTLLGIDKPRTWLLLMQNGAEARSTGGLVGAVGLLTSDDGKLRLRQVESNDRLAEISIKGWQSIVGDDGAVEVYSEQLSSLLGLNVTGDFPTVGRLTAALKLQADSVKVDGVLAMDEHTLAHLMRVTGPINVDGNQISADTVVDFVTKDVYARYMSQTTPTTVRKKDAVLRLLIAQVFGRLEERIANPFVAMKSIGSAVIDGRVALWLSNPTEQREVLKSPLSHALSGPRRPTVAVHVNNGGGNKLEAYISVAADYRRGTCLPGIGARKASMTVAIRNTAPRAGLVPYVSGRVDLGIAKPRPQGTNREVVFLHLPAGTEFESADLGGKAQLPTGFGREGDYRLMRFDLESVAGTTQVLNVSFLEPIEAAAAKPTIGVQPMTLPMSATVHPAPMCPATP